MSTTGFPALLDTIPGSETRQRLTGAAYGVNLSSQFSLKCSTLIQYWIQEACLIACFQQTLYIELLI